MNSHQVARADWLIFAAGTDYFDETFYGGVWDDIVQTDDLSPPSIGVLVRVALESSSNTVLSDDELLQLLFEVGPKGRELSRDHLLHNAYVSRDRQERVAWSIVIDQLMWNPEGRGRLARILRETEDDRTGSHPGASAP